MIRRLQPALASVEGITLFMQPVQDLTVEDRVSRTQYPVQPRGRRRRRLNVWAPRLLDRLRALPELATSPAISRTAGCARSWSSSATPRRGWASRRRRSTTLYDAYGQRQVSTMFTQLNQYHVILEVEPKDQPGIRRRSATFTYDRIRRQCFARGDVVEGAAVRQAGEAVHAGKLRQGVAAVLSGLGGGARRTAGLIGFAM